MEQPDQNDGHGLHEHDAQVPTSSRARTSSTKQPDRDDEHGSQAAPASFSSLPDIAHASIASFLQDGDAQQASRLRLSEVSRALFESYGGSLTKICFSYVEDSSTARLVALLRRQALLAESKFEQGEHSSTLRSNCPRLLSTS